MIASDSGILNTFKTLLQKKVAVRKIAVFGSRARGDADPLSDMDVLVVVDGLNDDIRGYISDCAWEAGFESGVVVTPVVFSTDEWESGLESESLLAEAIRLEGVFV